MPRRDRLIEYQRAATDAITDAARELRDAAEPKTAWLLVETIKAWAGEAARIIERRAKEAD